MPTVERLGKGDSAVAHLTIRDLDDGVKEKLRARAARRGRSMEEEARAILQQAVNGITGAQFLRKMADSIGPEHGVDLDLPRRSSRRDAADFSQGQ